MWTCSSSSNDLEAKMTVWAPVSLKTPPPPIPLCSDWSACGSLPVGQTMAGWNRPSATINPATYRIRLLKQLLLRVCFWSVTVSIVTLLFRLWKKQIVQTETWTFLYQLTMCNMDKLFHKSIWLTRQHHTSVFLHVKSSYYNLLSLHPPLAPPSCL